ncbi:probable ATP-dependent RNA helicase DDX31 isoform X1 [Gadus chalcogrammus]|uniref:probable ATP-dependent RNA helicase DDX31 isoform X1 n=1 Tax=Gadus chalcogrammus TaxID=1042646 RepID=UPI0024C431AB|nr:probable ATP-dependent RNA helicase DDX31 isoform X1 [Gadus chalcogrammus]
MSSNDQLSLNIHTETFPDVAPRRKPLSGQEKWLLKKQKAGKRKAGPEMRSMPSFKQRKTEEEEAPIISKQDQAPPSKTSPTVTTPQEAPPTKTKKKKKREGGGQGRGEQKNRDAGEKAGHEGGFIKTSSLFNHNPDIPDLERPVVSEVKEKVFTTDSFSNLGLHPHLVATLEKVLGVSTMTSVQKQTIPALMSGRDAVVRSQTGSGKTLSYGIPIVQSLQAVLPKIQRADGPLALILVPTRELAQQSFQIFQKLVKPFTWIVPGVLMGGEKRKAEKARLRKGINILVSTPGRLVDHINNTLNMVFSSVQWLVLDEADRILDMGFEKDLTVILNSLNSNGPSRQNVLLSATLTNDLARLSDVCLKDPVSVQVSDPNASEVTPSTGSSTQPGSQSESFSVPEALKQHMVLVPSKLRLVCLASFIMDKCKFSEGNKMIVFMASCEAVEFLLSLFKSVLCGSSAKHQPLKFLRLHGNMKQEERTEVYEEFSVSKSGVLLCTDVAARGLDLPQVTWIVQYNPPISAAEYVHRVGRTARIGAEGNSLLFLTPAETAYIDELANHNISLSEMKLYDILSTLMQDDAYKGRGKYHSKSSSSALQQEVRERATVLQTEFENAVHANQETLQGAKKALQSFLRSYTAYPTALKHIFHIRSLHLGHAAKSFGLRDAPQSLSSHTGSGARRGGSSSKHNRTADKAEMKLKLKRREASLLTSEFSSGLDGIDLQNTEKKPKDSVPFLSGRGRGGGAGGRGRGGRGGGWRGERGNFRKGSREGQ